METCIFEVLLRSDASQFQWNLFENCVCVCVCVCACVHISRDELPNSASDSS
jgi:hypothetical protein